MEFKINPKPWLTEESINFLEEFLKSNPRTVLELGSGGSTIWFSKRAFKLISFEHDLRWYELINAQVKDLQNVDYKFYKGTYFNFINELPDSFFDLVIVDGKDRIECIQNSVRVLKPGGILMLDDAQREQYKVVNDILKDWKFYTTQDFDKEKNHVFETNWWIKP